VGCWGLCWEARSGRELLGAVGAGSVDEEVVAGIFEAAGKPWLGVHLAAFELVDGAADVALEVMVMGFAGDLVASGVAWDFDGCEPLVFDEVADVAIDGGDADGFNLFLSKGKRFVGGERAICFEESGADSVFLTGVARLDGGGHEQTYSSVLRGSSQLPLLEGVCIGVGD
jgi:hypothetical protein